MCGSPSRDSGTHGGPCRRAGSPPLGRRYTPGRKRWGLRRDRYRLGVIAEPTVTGRHSGTSVGPDAGLLATAGPDAMCTVVRGGGSAGPVSPRSDRRGRRSLCRTCGSLSRHSGTHGGPCRRAGPSTIATSHATTATTQASAAAASAGAASGSAAAAAGSAASASASAAAASGAAGAAGGAAAAAIAASLAFIPGPKGDRGDKGDPGEPSLFKFRYPLIKSYDQYVFVPELHIDPLAYVETTTFSTFSTSTLLSINNLNNKTNFSNLLISGSSTLLSTLNVSGQ